MSKPASAPSPIQSAKKPSPGKPDAAPSVLDRCTASGCKSADKRFSFCDEHYEQFKFGLIKKNGQPVPDHEKKFEHYHAHRARMKARKVA
jgi:hypothetical protein